MYRISVTVSGKVQGVWFRKYTRDKAMELNLIGWVKNSLNGEVELVAEGEVDGLTQLADWLQDGSPVAEVEEVKVTWNQAKNEFSTFEIAR